MTKLNILNDLAVVHTHDRDFKECLSIFKNNTIMKYLVDKITKQKTVFVVSSGSLREFILKKVLVRE